MGYVRVVGAHSRANNGLELRARLAPEASEDQLG